MRLTICPCYYLQLISSVPTKDASEGARHKQNIEPYESMAGESDLRKSMKAMSTSLKVW
jgi:hypothetical protein